MMVSPKFLHSSMVSGGVAPGPQGVPGLDAEHCLGMPLSLWFTAGRAADWPVREALHVLGGAGPAQTIWGSLRSINECASGGKAV